jgi:hypothetical protein
LIPDLLQSIQKLLAIGLIGGVTQGRDHRIRAGLRDGLGHQRGGGSVLRLEKGGGRIALAPESQQGRADGDGLLPELRHREAAETSGDIGIPDPEKDPEESLHAIAFLGAFHVSSLEQRRTNIRVAGLLATGELPTINPID